MKGSAMSSLAAIIRVPFYRVLVNLGAGVGALTVAAFLPPAGQPECDSSQLQDVSASIGPLSSFSGWLFLLIATLVVGEVFCTAGEMILGLFFCSSPYREPETGNGCKKSSSADTIMERVAPGAKRFVCYGSFTNDKDMGYEISEVHFCLARLFAGLMAAGLAGWWPLLPFIAAIASTFLIATCSRRIICDLLVIFIFAGLVCYCFHCVESSAMKRIAYLVIMVLFTGCAGVHYRAHANQILLAMK
jgi:hypothetical protein